MSTEIRGDEHDGWTHTLEIQTAGRKVVLDTYYRRPADVPTPVALGPVDALRTAVAIVHAAKRALPETVTAEQAADVLSAVAELEDLATLLRHRVEES